MNTNITINQAAEKAHQVELINLLIESHPHQLQDSEISALSSLMAKLSGDVCVFLQKEIEAQGATHEPVSHSVRRSCLQSAASQLIVYCHSGTGGGRMFPRVIRSHFYCV